VSVDTYLKGKDTSTYTRMEHEDIAVLVAPVMARWSERIRLAANRGLLRRRFDITVEHQHGPACQH
jgi:hypothetical protein